jgi:hypothetical protein
MPNQPLQQTSRIERIPRWIFRWIHIIFSIPILGYIYSLFEKPPNYAPRNSVCLPSCNGPFGIVDVERPCLSTTSAIAT